MDTVGFISHLPHSLVESFKSTLDEVHYADILLHVRDVANPSFEFQKESVFKVLWDIGYDEKKPYFEVWNKIDLLT